MTVRPVLARLSTGAPGPVTFGEDGLTLGVEDMIRYSLSAAPARWHPAPFRPVLLPLRPGAEARIAGVLIRIGGGAERWTAVAAGAFEPWVQLREDRTGFTGGSLRVDPSVH